ncbi:hypothetical protein [Motilimonas sp. KMU-193]|uniref:hypothetical protein n=1 Tax=Motilimonas sp. KMU-193 TaxID=3388668 RepID=UPI00396B1083
MKLELKRIIQILVVLSVLIAAFVYRTLTPNLTPSVTQTGQATQAQSSNLCDFSQGCTAQVFATEIQIKAPAQTKIIAETPIELELALAPGMQISKAYLKGKDMFMGTIPVIFNQQKQADQYQGELLLGACITEKMIWQLTLELTQNEQTGSAVFDFEMRNH